METGNALVMVLELAKIQLNVETVHHPDGAQDAINTVEDLIVNNFGEDGPPTWEQIPDDKVVVIWKKNCDCAGPDSVSLPPGWPADNGTPLCGCCGDEMAYSHTEILLA
jgi:hypothetical protein